MFGLLVLAVAPSLALFLFFYLRGRSKGPAPTIITTFLLGAAAVAPAALATIGLERLTGWRSSTPDLLQSLLGALFIVGVVEETAKFLVVRLHAFPRREFDEPYDGILYSVIAALGFATVENIYYVLTHGAGTGIARALVAVPNHAFCGVLMGFFLGLAKFVPSDIKGDLLAGLGLALAVLAHGVYDWIVFSVRSTPLLVVFLLLFAALAWVIIFRATRHHAERSPYGRPLLADLHRNGVSGRAVPTGPAVTQSDAIAARDRARPAYRSVAGTPTAFLESETDRPGAVEVVGDADGPVVGDDSGADPRADTRPRA